MIFNHGLFCSGLLTGKYKREEKLSPGSGRIGFVAADETVRSKQSAPAWSKVVNNDKYWALLDVMRKIAENHGEEM